MTELEKNPAETFAEAASDAAFSDDLPDSTAELSEIEKARRDLMLARLETLGNAPEADSTPESLTPPPSAELFESEEPIAEESVAQEPSLKPAEPIPTETELPVAEEPFVDESAAEQSYAEPADFIPTEAEPPVTEEPIVDESAAQGPYAESTEPIPTETEPPVAEESFVDESTVQEPYAESAEPAPTETEPPVAEEPAAFEPPSMPKDPVFTADKPISEPVAAVSESPADFADDQSRHKAFYRYPSKGRIL